MDGPTGIRYNEMKNGALIATQEIHKLFLQVGGYLNAQISLRLVSMGPWPIEIPQGSPFTRANVPFGVFSTLQEVCRLTFNLILYVHKELTVSCHTAP